ncbi:MAG: saccharopine dehydrogenase NADP-binding domain-containing protein [Gammaproteobacteria bacterium]|nr:saccharopine dehydrogenase NADP-binding domain-containing protein [Gammaproteobacteria bacterium]MBU1646018.1 saccharopine dehydrogenase NADP-binding domain-containing protein [Gammaproteobacteria bacterium]MBU1972080.1 saccharopine dehydrogenase NADP-binding domain-containing protein [Gammaproteobacteria bacterium]
MQKNTLAQFSGRLLMVGFGCIGRGVLPLLLRHIDIDPARIRIVTEHDGHREIADAHGIAMRVEAMTPDNYRRILDEELGAGDFLLNLSINVGSVDLIAWCQAHDVAYLDACIEPWAGGYYDAALTPSQRSNYGLRESALALRRAGSGGPTAVLTHGVNPGLVSHFVKKALLDIAAATGDADGEPTNRAGWAALAQRLGVKAIHIAERDTQVSALAKRPGEFVNTWSIEGFAGEGCQPAELGWGSHERHWPPDARRHGYGCDAAVYLQRPGVATRVRSWTPLEGPYHGFLITHGESVSIADFLTVRDGEVATYRPTVHYAYHPCDDAVLSLHELAGKNWHLQQRRRELRAADIHSGMDELGVLLAGHAKNAYWYGSRLSIGQARELCPLNNATSLQTAAGVLGGVVWALRHPQAGIVDPDDMDWREVMAVAGPYLGEMAGVFSEWTPLEGRGELFPEDVDASDPWQFKNVRV